MPAGVAVGAAGCYPIGTLWAPGFSLTPRFENERFFVGDWQCSHPVPGGQNLERPRYTELSLHRLGSQTRRTECGPLVADPTTLLWQRAGTSYGLSHPNEAPQASTVILLAPSLADEALEGLGAAGALPLGGEVALLHYRLRRASDPIELEELVLSLVARLGGRPAQRPRGGGRPSLVREVRHVLASRYAERLTLARVAAEVGVSPFHLARLFRQATGDSIHRHLRRVRLRVALAELDTFRGDLSALALRVGFSSHSHFTSAFREEFGVAPSALAPRRAADEGRIGKIG